MFHSGGSTIVLREFIFLPKKSDDHFLVVTPSGEGVHFVTQKPKSDQIHPLPTRIASKNVSEGVRPNPTNPLYPPWLQLPILTSNCAHLSKVFTIFNGRATFSVSWNTCCSECSKQTFTCCICPVVTGMKCFCFIIHRGFSSLLCNKLKCTNATGQNSNSRSAIKYNTELSNPVCVTV